MGFYGRKFDLHPIGDAILVINEEKTFYIHCRHNYWVNTYITVIMSCVMKLGENFIEYNGSKNEIYENKILIQIKDFHQA